VYRVVFKVEKDTIYILHIIHGRRQPAEHWRCFRDSGFRDNKPLLPILPKCSGPTVARQEE